jgi:uncharacterized protein (DUF2062 family)
MPDPVAPVPHGWFYHRTVLPVLALLRMGATPRALAWSLTAGLLIGINPLLGTTTILSLAVAFVFRLNLVASQTANHAAWPLEIALMVPFIRLGAWVFHTAAMPIAPKLFLNEVRAAPLHVLRQVWMWEWHALVVWGVMATVAAPLMVMALTPMLIRLQSRVQGHQYPIVPR